MSLQNRIKDILYKKADLMGYGGDGGYLKGSNRQMYADARQRAMDNYPQANELELKRLVRHYVKAELGIHQKAYIPRIGVHQNENQRSAARRNIRSGKLMAYRQLYDVVMLSPHFLALSAADKRQEAKRLASMGLSVGDAINQLDVNLDDYDRYINLPVRGDARKKFIYALKKIHGIGRKGPKLIEYNPQGLGYY